MLFCRVLGFGFWVVLLVDLFFLLREKIVRLEKKKETTDCILISVVKYTYDVWQRLPTVPDRPWTIGWSPWRIRARPWFLQVLRGKRGEKGGLLDSGSGHFKT